MARPLIVFATSSAKTLGERVIDEISKIHKENDIDGKISLGEAKETVFADDSAKVEILQSVRDRDAYVLATPPDPISRRLHGFDSDLLPSKETFSREEILDLLKQFRKTVRTSNDNFRMLLAYVSALHSAETGYVTAIPTVFPDGRQENPRGREPNMARLTAEELELAGARRILTLDIHAEAVQGFFRTAHFDNLRSGKYLLQGFREQYEAEHKNYESLSVLSPDKGGNERSQYYADKLRVPLVFSYKKRDRAKANVVEEVIIIGDVKDRDILIPDDMVDTGGTIDKVARAARDYGAKEVYLLCTHPILNHPATDLLQKLHADGILKCLIASDTVHHGAAYLAQKPWFKEVSLAPLIARAIYNLNEGRSISKLL